MSTSPSSHSSCNSNHIQCVPDEVLTQIFELALYRNVWMKWRNYKSGGISTASNSPLLFMQVCRRWYSVCTSCTTLWTTFITTIVKSESSLEDLSRLPAIFKQYLLHSKETPLTIKLSLVMNRRLEDGLCEVTQDVLNESDTMGVRTMATLLRMAFGHSKYWENVFIYVESSDDQPDDRNSFLPQIRLENMPYLRLLDVSGLTLENSASIALASHNALESLRLHKGVYFCDEDDSAQPKICFPNMRALDVRTNGINSCLRTFLNILHASPTLESLAYNFVSYKDENFIFPAQKIGLRKVERFEIHLGKNSFSDVRRKAIGLLTTLTLPALKSLTFNESAADTITSVELQEILRNVGTSVTNLQINLWGGSGRWMHFTTSLLSDIPLSSWVSFLRPFGNLVDLTISVNSGGSFGLTTRMLHTLSLFMEQEQQTILPLLKRLCIGIDARLVLENYKLATNFLRTCRDALQRCTGVFTLQLEVRTGCGSASSHASTTCRAEELMVNKPKIRECACATFRIRVNSLELLPI